VDPEGLLPCSQEPSTGPYPEQDQSNHLLTDTQNILNRWKNYLSQLFNVHRLSDVKQKEIRSHEALTPESVSFDTEIALANFKKYKSPDIN
jgi:hypothetical protein